VTSRFLLGGEIEMWRRGGDDVVQRVLSIGLVSQMYPVVDMPVFVKLGLGYMRYKASNAEDALHSGSLALRVGGGFDINVRQYVVSPVASFTNAISLGLSLNDDQVTNTAWIKMLQFGLAIGVR
jgi:hypothetical protein